MTTIYAIWFPEADDHSVYVGLTNHFDKRRREHLYESKRDTKRIVYKWIRRRVEQGFEPEFTVLEEVESSLASDSEIAWQRWFVYCGWKPKHQKGGDHQVGFVFTEEHRRNMSDAAKKRVRKPHSEETKARQSAAWTEERKAKHREMVQSEERRRKVSEGLKRAYSEGKFKPERLVKDDACRNGHPRTESNTYTPPNGQRQCLDCKAENLERVKAEGPRCIVEGCTKHQHARRLCSTHYSRWRRVGKG